MKLPEWIPQVPRPWNSAYHEVWEVMTPNERRWSFLVDVALGALGAGLLTLAVLFDYGVFS